MLIVYDVSNRKSFDSLDYWLRKIDDNSGLNIQKLIVANKCDLTYNRNVSRSEGEEFAKRNNLNYMETSAKVNKNVGTVFENLAFDVFWDVKNKKIMPDNEGSNGVKTGDYLNQDEKRNSGSHQKLKKKKHAEEKKKKCC